MRAGLTAKRAVAENGNAEDAVKIMNTTDAANMCPCKKVVLTVILLNVYN
jgi:hypothetical protein